MEHIAADTGYSSGKALKACIDNNITAYIPNFGHYKPLREGFVFDQDNDRYTCTSREVFTCPTKERTRIKKVITKSSIAAVPKIVVTVPYEQVALAVGPIIKSWKKPLTNPYMTRCMKDCKPLMQSG